MIVATGYVTFDEFAAIARKKMQDDEDERELREMFRILDKEKRGEVNTNELRSVSSHGVFQTQKSRDGRSGTSRPVRRPASISLITHSVFFKRETRVTYYISDWLADRLAGWSARQSLMVWHAISASEKQ